MFCDARNGPKVKYNIAKEECGRILCDPSIVM